MAENKKKQEQKTPVPKAEMSQYMMYIRNFGHYGHRLYEEARQKDGLPANIPDPMVNLIANELLSKYGVQGEQAPDSNPKDDQAGAAKRMG